MALTDAEKGRLKRAGLSGLNKPKKTPSHKTKKAVVAVRVAPTPDEKPPGTIAIDVGDPTALDEIFLFLCEARAVGRNPVDE